MRVRSSLRMIAFAAVVTVGSMLPMAQPARAVTLPTGCKPTTLSMAYNRSYFGIWALATWPVSKCTSSLKAALFFQNQTGPTSWSIVYDAFGTPYGVACNTNMECYNSLTWDKGQAHTWPVYKCSTGNFRAVFQMDGVWFYGPAQNCADLKR